MGRIEDGFPDCRFASSRFGTARRGAGTVLFGWFGKRTARDREDADPLPIPERDAASERSRFQLEALEPRLGKFCEFGTSVENRPVFAPNWLKFGWMQWSP